MQFVVTSFSDATDIFDTLLMDFHNFNIQREWRNIDILAVSVEHRFVLCIENKIDSKEHNNQLKRYREIVEEEYPGYKKMLIYLSPDGGESSEPEYWCSMGYQNILDIIENSCKKIQLLPDAELLINNYIEMVRRDIVSDEKLAQVCAEIYAKHQKALDLIFENKPDRASDIAEIFRDWAEQATRRGEIQVVLEKCSKSHTRFKTKNMSMLLPDAAEAQSGWNTRNHYFYEIDYNGVDEFQIQLAFSAKNIPSDLKEMCERISKFYPSKQNKTNWEWRKVFSTRKSKIDDETSEDTIFEQLDKKLCEINEFEQKLIKDRL
ncbi:MAG TPA: PD-(D/E)XK nuclease family protein [Candidatus Dojkabacteria bacterium]|nr:PD-(D/E)XK nuclease family protein [Candidatus Dojkabacteria bacterium]